MGRNIGMGYNYFKVILKVMRPTDNNKAAEVYNLNIIL